MENERLTALGIAGSLREGSYNRALVRAAPELAPEGLEIHIFDNELLKQILRITRMYERLGTRSR